MKRLAIAVGLGLLLAVPAAAPAAQFPPRVDFAYDLAIDYWGEEPSACASLDRQVVAPGTMINPLRGLVVSGRATHTPPDAPPGSIGCFIWIDRAYTEPIIFDLLCAVMLHNVGHLLGKGYSPDPSSVMHQSIPVPGLCGDKGRQSARMHLLRLQLRQLRGQRDARAASIRSRTRRQLRREARRFWGSGARASRGAAN